MNRLEKIANRIAKSKEELAKEIVEKMRGGKSIEGLGLTEEQYEAMSRLYDGIKYSEKSKESLVEEVMEDL